MFVLVTQDRSLTFKEQFRNLGITIKLSQKPFPVDLGLLRLGLHQQKLTIIGQIVHPNGTVLLCVCVWVCICACRCVQVFARVCVCLCVRVYVCRFVCSL